MTGWRIGRPPREDEELARWRIDQPPQLRGLRADLQKAVHSRTRTDTDVSDLVERLVVVATELAGNALRHGSPPASVVLLRSDGHLIVDVLDNDPDSAPAADPDRPSGAGGLGMPLAERLSMRVGWYPATAGKHVWAVFAFPENVQATR